MTAVVLDTKVSVGGHGLGKLGEGAFDGRLLVAQFMCGINTQAAERTCSHCH